MVILVRYAEIGIKGKNREHFERVLMDNIASCLNAHAIPFKKVRRLFGRIIVETDNPCTQLKTVFGIASFSQAVPAGKTVEEAFAATREQVQQLTDRHTFRVSCQRLDKTFAITSQQLCIQLGEKLLAATKAKVKMQQPSVDVAIEIIDGMIYALASRIEGPGGMPAGSQGKAIVLIENDASVLAALLVLKRGCSIIPAVLKETDLALLKSFAYATWHEPIAIKSVAELDALAEKHRAPAVILNDTLTSIREISLKALVLRPLSAHSAEDITNERKQFEHLFDADRP